MRTLAEDIVEQIELLIYDAGAGYHYVDNYLRHEDPERFTEHRLEYTKRELDAFKYILRVIKATIKKHERKELN